MSLQGRPKHKMSNRHQEFNLIYSQDGDGLENDEDPDDDGDGVMDQGSHQSRNYYLTSNIQNLLRWI